MDLSLSLSILYIHARRLIDLSLIAGHWCNVTSASGEFYLQNDEFCIINMEFAFKMMDFVSSLRPVVVGLLR